MSISTVLVPDQVQSANTNKLRELDPSEELLWLFEQSVNMLHSVVVDVHGPTTIEQWKAGIDAMQIRYPLLSASIRKNPGERPFFEKAGGASIALRIAPLTHSIVLEDELENELQHSFGDGSGPLTRATLFHAEDRTVILFSTHHCSMDGKSHLLLVQDLLAYVAGEDLGKPLKLQPGLTQLLGLPALAEYAKKLEESPANSQETGSLDLPRIRAQRLQLTVEETEALLERARKEKTTIHAALVVALALSGKHSSEKWSVGRIHCMSPIDMRKILEIPSAAGLLISSHSGPVSTSGEDSFWEVTRAVRKDMLAAQSADGARHFVGAISAMVAEEHNARDFYESIVNGPLQHELMVTNYAGYKARTEYGSMKITDLFTGSSSMTPDLQKVSVLTLNGRLGMTLVARDLFSDLLSGASKILTEAVRS